MKKKILLFIIILMVFSGVHSLFASEGSVDFNIRLFDRRIYYVNTDPILIQITINNNSPDTFRFKLADERAFSIEFDIRTMTNRSLEEADSLIRKKTQMQHIYFREIAIETGESFSFIEDLRDFAKFDQSGSFRVKAKIYPELQKSSGSVIESNYLALNLRPPLIPGSDGIPLEMDVATGAVLVRQSIPPDEVVSYMITARQQSQWERFFLYLDLESMLSRDAAMGRKWRAENEEGRRRMVQEYRKNLQNSAIDGDISVIPTSFEILRTVYNNNEGTVTVLQKFKYVNFTDLKRYTYYLERRDNIWYIVNYTVEGMGQEANN